MSYLYTGYCSGIQIPGFRQESPRQIPIPEQCQSSACKAAIRNKETTDKYHIDEICIAKHRQH